MASSVVDIRRQFSRDQGDSPKLSPMTQRALEYCRQLAREGKPLTQIGLTIAIGSGNWTGSTASGVLNCLEKEGYITRTYYQRGVQVCFPDGTCTAEPTNRSTHWRARPPKEAAQTPPIHALRNGRHAPVVRIIEQEATASGKPMHEFLQDLVFNGLELWLEKRENEE